MPPGRQGIRRPVPATVLTGFLGAGKTTLLNRLLAEPGLAGTAVIINEFGDIGLDHLFVETVAEGVIALPSGCLCCTVRGDLVDTLERLLDRAGTGERLDRILIETTGLADPAPVLQTLLHLAGRLSLAGVVTVVDGAAGLATLEAHEEARRQVAVADRIVISKTDLAGATAARDALSARIRSLNPGAAVLDGCRAEDVTADRLLAAGPTDGPARERTIDDWLGACGPGRGPGWSDGHGGATRHDHGIRAAVLQSPDPVSARAFQMFVDLLTSLHGPSLLRVKGIVRLQDHPETPLIVHGVQHIWHPPAFLDGWPEGDDRSTRLVVITKDVAAAAVEDLFAAFTGRVGPDRPDAAALTENPLAIAGTGGPFRPGR